MFHLDTLNDAFGALLRTMSQEKVAQHALRVAGCSDRFVQEGAPKNSCWKEAEQVVDVLQILHTFLISSPEKDWEVFVPISLTHCSPWTHGGEMGLTALQMKTV